MESQTLQVKKVEAHKTGFARIKPWNTGCDKHDPHITIVNPRNHLTEEYIEFILKRGPYFFFITITFKLTSGFEARCKHTNYLLHQFNRRLFRHNYKKRNKFVEGFAFFEDHPSQFLKDKPHIHLLIKYNEVFDKKCIDEYKEMFLNAAYEVKNAWGKRVFSNKCIDFGAAGHDIERIKYCTKVIWDKTITDIKYLGIDGLSDNLRRQ